MGPRPPYNLSTAYSVFKQCTTPTVLGAPRTERGPGASSNMTDFRFLNSKTDGENAAVLSEL